MATKRTGQNLVELRPGYWKVTVNIPASESPDGKRHRRVAYVTGGVRMARAKRDDMMTQRAQGKLKPRTAGTVSEYLDRWLKAKKPNVAARTLRRWESLAKNQVKPHIGAKLLRDVKPRDLRTLYADLQATGLSGTTIHKVHSLLNMAFRQALIDADIPINPCSAVAAPKTDTPEASALDEKQAKALLAALTDSPLYVPVLVALDCGLRRGELLALSWEDTDLEGGTIVVRGAVEEDGRNVEIRATKTRRVRVVRLTRRATAALAEHRKTQAALRLVLANRWADQALVFPATDEHRGKLAGRIWRPSSFSRVFREQTRAAGFTIGLHALRHTQATVMLRAGVPARVVADRLGHSTTNLTTDTYSHVMPDTQQAAVEAYERRMEEAGE
jgi:integrase